MKKPAILILFGALFSVVIMATNVAAASYGDDYYVQSDGLNVSGRWIDYTKSPLEYHPCSSTDISGSYVSILSKAAKNDPAVDEYYQSFLRAIKNDGVWGAAQHHRQYAGVEYDEVIIAFSEDPNTVPIGFNSQMGIIATPLTNTNNSWKMFTIKGFVGNQKTRCGGDYTVTVETLGAKQWAIFSTSPTAYVSNGDWLWVKTYFINAPINYPAGYEGKQINKTGVVKWAIDSLTPAWSYAVENKSLTVNSLLTDQQIDQYQIDVCLFQIPNNIQGDNFNEYVYDCKSRPPIEHEFGELGNYNIIHRVKTVDGQWFDSARVLNIDGSTYNSTVGSAGSNKAILDSLGKISTNTHGLSNIITAPLGLLANLPNLANFCTPVTAPLGSLGNITFPCMTPIYQEKLGNLFTIWQIVLVGVFSYRMGLALFQKIKNLSSPNDDRIEVVNL